MELQAFLLSILLLSIVAGSEARSVDQICSDKCKDGLRTFFVKDDYEYSYFYRTTIESSFHTESSLDQKSRLSIEVPFSIITKSDCNLVLKVKRGINFDNRNPDTQDELDWQEAVTAYPLHFSWQNGVVDVVCPSTNEPIWVSNFKRGLLSSLQTRTKESESAVRELDVSGDCEADYFVKKSDPTIIQKTKDYTKCSNRDKHLLFSWSLPYELSSPRQNYIYSQQSCQLVVADVLKSVNCSEEHVFRPFSTDEAGARTHITQYIEFLHQRRASSDDYSRAVIRHTNLEYEEELDITATASNQAKLRATKALLTEICNSMDGETYQNVGKQFVSLVYAVRELNAESLTELNAHIETCSEWRSSLKQMLANTMPFCGTESCVTFASSLIMTNALEEKVAERWLTGFGLIKEPTTGMISSVLGIVESQKFASQSFLTIGSMIHQFCQNSEENCLNNAVISSSVEVLTRHLGTNCRSPNLATRKLTLLALRAVGNAGQITSHTTLRRCIEENQNLMEIRIAASAAYRRMPCKTDRSVLMTTLLDGDEDSELRISSYLNLMECPSEKLVKKVKNMLETEQNMQVGSYIWSHLAQIMESQDPLKYFFQMILQGQTFKEFSLDPRKYSRFYEASLFSEKLNMGGTAEASLVWSPKSFVPRSASVNLTLDLFGQAVNLLEFGGRIEGVENYLQSLLEPKAYEKRNARKATSPFESGRYKNPAKRAIADGAHASWFMRVFGNELMYGNTEMNEPIESDSVNTISSILAKFMSDDGYTYHDDALLLNSMHTLPTGIGMPLVLAFNGSTTLDINAAGKFNMGFGSSPEYLVKGKVTPRAAVILTGSMLIDAHVKKTGIATESMAYTSSSLGGHVKIMNRGKSFEVELESPYSKNMAFNFNHKLLKIVGNDMEEFVDNERHPLLNEDITCTGVHLGQKLCYNVQYHTDRYSRGATNSLIFPVDGAVELSAYMQKVDQGLTKYTLSGSGRTVYEQEHDMIPNSMLLKLAFDTPGSEVNRKATVFASYSVPDKQIAIRAQRGEETLKLQGHYTANDGANELQLSAEVNEETYLFRLGVQKTFEEDRKEIATDILIQLPEKTMSAKGLMIYNAGERFQASFTMNNVLPSPVEITLNLQDNTENQDRLSFSGNGKLSVLPFVNSEFVMDMSLNPTRDNMILNVNYKIGRTSKHSIFFHHKRTNLGRNKETDWNVYHKLTSSQFNALNHKVSVMHSYSTGSTKSSLDIGYGSQIDEDENPYKLEVRQEYSDTSDSSTTKLNGGWSIKFPYIKADRELTFKYSSNLDQIIASIDSVVANQPNYFTFSWKNNNPGSQLMDQTTDIALHPTPYGDWRLVNEWKEASEKIYHSTTTLSLGETDELQFIQETVITKQTDNKSIEFSLKKGVQKNEIFTASSSNYFTEDSKYISKNQMHLAGYAQRGLDFSYQKSLTTGCTATVNFIESSSVSVGIDATYLPKASGKHFSVGVRQYDIQQRTVLVKAGYDMKVNKLFECYATLTEDDSTLFSSQTSVNHANDETTGSVSLVIKGHPSLPFSRDINTDTSASFAISDSVQLAVSHLRKHKKLNFTLDAATNGVHGVLKHNYYDFLQDASYNVARTSDGVNAVVFFGGSPAHFTTRWSKNVLRLRWDHQDVPDLLELNVPRQADLLFDKNSGYHTLLTVDSKIAFEMTCLCPKQDLPITKLSMTNNLLSVFPKTASLSYSTDGEVLVDVEINSEKMHIAATFSPNSASAAVSHNLKLLQIVNVPTSFELRYNFESLPRLRLELVMGEINLILKGNYSQSSLEATKTSQGTESLLTQILIGVEYRATDGNLNSNLIVGERSLTLEGKYSQSSMEASMTSQGTEFLPRKMLISLEHSITDDKMQISGKAEWNEKTYAVNSKASMKFKPSSTFVPFINFVGKEEFNIEFSMNEKKKLVFTHTINIRADEMSEVYEVQQSLTEDYPASMKEEHSISLKNDIFSLLFEGTSPGSAVLHFHIEYTTGRVQLDQSIIEMIPKDVSIVYNFENEYGEITMHLKGVESGNASLSYSIPATGGFGLEASHTFDSIASFIPKIMTFTGKNLLESEIQIQYAWGEENGSIRLWKHSWADMGANIEANDRIHFNFSYDITNTGFKSSCELTYDELTFSASFDGGYKLSSANLKGGHGNLKIKLNNWHFISLNSMELKSNAMLVNVVLTQNLCREIQDYTFVRELSWNVETSSFSFEINGTEQDPFFLKVMVNRVDFNSATFEMHHRQEDWEQIPKILIANFQNTVQINKYEATLTVTTDVTMSATASLDYSLDEQSAFLDAEFKNDFANICKYCNIEHLGLHTRGSLTDSDVEVKLDLIFNDKIFNETFHSDFINFPGNLSVRYHYNQNILPALPRKTAFTLKKSPSGVKVDLKYDIKKISVSMDYSESELTLSVKCSSGEETALSTFELKWSKDPLKLMLNHDIKELLPVPKKAILQWDRDESNLRISAVADNSAYEILLQKVETENAQKIILRHNLEIFPEVPQNFVLSYKRFPKTVSLQWDGYQVSVEKQQNGFVFWQNVLSTVPTSISMTVNYDTSSLENMVEFDIAVDNYSFQFHTVLGEMDSFSVKLLCIVSESDNQLFYLNATSKAGMTEGFNMIHFSQRLTDELLKNLNYKIEYNFGETTGFIAFDSYIEQPIKFKLTYNEVQSDEISFSLAHNLETVVDILPLESTGRLTTEWSDGRKGFTGTISSSEGTKSFSIALLTDMKSEKRTITATVMHNFDILETKVFIPKSASFDLRVSKESHAVSVEYVMDSKDNHVKLEMHREPSVVLLSLDQNVVKSSASVSNTRRRQIQVPQKVSLRLLKDSDGYQSLFSFKAGQKRRFFNVKYSNLDNKEQTRRKVTIDQNLNRMLQTNMPAESLLEVTVNSTTAALNLQWDENKMFIAACVDTTEKIRVDFSAGQNLEVLMEKGVPYQLELRMKQTDGDFSASVNYDDYSGDILLSKPLKLVINFKSNKLDVTFTSSGELNSKEMEFAITGTQTGLDSILPNDFHIKFSASYNLDEMSAAFSSSHNIEILELPKQLVASIQLPRFTKSRMNSRLSLQADDLLSENSLELAMAKKSSGIVVSINGVRTRNFWSTSQSDKLSYKGKLSAEFISAENMKSSLMYSFTETNLQGDTRTNHEARFDATWSGNEMAWTTSINLPTCFGGGFIISGSLLHGNTFKFNNFYSRNKYEVTVNISGVMGENFDLKIANGYGILSFRFDKRSHDQLSFSHNMALLDTLPRSVAVSLNVESVNATVIADYVDARALLHVQVDQINIAYISEGREIVAIAGKYSMHPSQEITSTINIIPLNVDISVGLQMQFFRPGDGKSYIDFSATNNTSERSLTSSIHAFLQDSNIKDINIGASVHSNFTKLPIQAALEYSLDNNPLNYKFLMNVQKYTFKLNGSEESFLVQLTMPEYIKINDVLITGSCTGTKKHRQSDIFIQVNKDKELGFKAAYGESQNSHFRAYELRQPFSILGKLSASYNFEEREKGCIIIANASADERQFNVVSDYTFSEEIDGVQHRLFVDISQQNIPIIPNAFKTTGIVKYGDLLYDSNWKITTGGEDVITLVKRYEVDSTGFESHISWKQPFDIAFLNHFNGSLTMHIESNTLHVTSAIDHSAVLEHIPQHFKTTGKTIINGGLYDSDWKITSEGENILILQKRFEISGDGLRTNLKWKHPFVDFFITPFDSSLNIKLRSGVILVDSEVNHSADCKHVPKHFVITGKFSFGDLLYDNDWKIASGGKDLVILKNLLKKTTYGYQMVVNWKQPFEEYLLTHYNMDAQLHLFTNTKQLMVDVSHPFNHAYIPKKFVTTGKMTISDKLYDCDWTITSGDKELVVFRNLFKATGSGFNAHFTWKQPYADLLATSLESSIDLTKDTSSSKLLGSLKYNDHQEWSFFCGLETPNSYSKNFTMGFTSNGERCESSFFYSVQSWQSTGKKLSMVYESNIPDNCFLSLYIPSQQQLAVTAYHKDVLTLLRTVYTSNKVGNPIVVQAMYQISHEKTLLNTSVAIKSTPESSPQMDAEFGLSVDRVGGVTAECKVPALGINHNLNVMLDQQTSTLTLTYLRARSDPIIIKINLKDVVSRLQKVLEALKQKDIWPRFKIIYNVRSVANLFDAHIGAQIRDTTYSLHLTTGYALETGYMNITTKRNFAPLDRLITISAHLVNTETAQIKIETSKELSRFLNFAFSSSAAEIKDRIIIIADALTESLNSFEGIVEGSDMIQNVINTNREMLIASVSNAKFFSLDFVTNINSGLLASIQDSEEGMRSGLRNVITLLSTAADKLREIANQPLLELKQDFLSTLSTQVYNMLQPKFQPLIQVLNNINAGQLLLELVQEGVTKFIFAMDKNAEAILNASKEPLAQLVYASESKVILNIPLHIPVNGLIGPPSLLDIAMWIGESSLAHEVERKLSILYKAVDLYYQYRSVLNMPLEELIPPFKGHSEIAGFRHIRTFDGQRYDYRSDCESKHVLARDVRDNEFTVFVTYDSIPSITVQTIDSLGGQESIVLKSDYTVTDERGRNILVPTEYADVLVTRVGEIVTVQTAYGLVVSCNFASELCTIDVSPFYFARLAGMMGTFNNEINDELMAHGMISVNDFEELAEAWKLPGPLCRASNAEQRCTEQTSDACVKLFEDRSSELSACFVIEDPAPYKQMCLKDSCSSGGICSAFAAYARRCALHGVALSSPPSCMTCDSVDGREMRSANDVMVSGADVVFVIEKSGCIRFRKKDYRKIIGEIHSALNGTVATGNVNYAVVGFGGPENLASPHSITFGNKIFLHTASDDLNNANERSILNALKRGQKANTESDVLQALSYAAQLPFRAGAARAIILLTCDDCSSESQVQTSYVRGLLQEQGAVLHHLRQKNIQAGKSSKKVYGFNTENIYSKGADATLPRRALKISSSDQCLPLADMTRGSIWNSNVIGRESVQLLANEISKGINSMEQQDCVCGISEYGTSTAKCTIAASRR